MSNLVPAARRHRTGIAMAFDATVWLAAYATCGRMLEWEQGPIRWEPILLLALISVISHVAVAWLFRLHHGRARTGSLEEMMMLGVVVTVPGIALAVANLAFGWTGGWIPIAASAITLVLTGWGRGYWRQLNELDSRTLPRENSKRVLVVGAGDGGHALVTSMLRDPGSEWQPVGLVDDDTSKRFLRICGVPVVGATRCLGQAIERTGARHVVIAIPSAGADVIGRISEAATAAGAEVKVLPSTNELLSDQVGIRDIRDINLTDVLGRNELDTDVEAIADYVRGRRVLVTGAGGSIGSELCRQLVRFDPAELMMLDRDESALHAVQLSIHGRALLDSGEVVLCDIRDMAAVTQIFVERRPEVVFHAAALKHLPMLEQYPVEAIKSNVIGTRNVLRAADLVDVQRFVNISTDKAANPCSVLGYSKRIAERVTAEYATTATGSYLSVRFGNVLGSRGSVLTSFAKQIAAGGPVTVTDPHVTRYFMTIEEACQLVIQAGAIGRSAEALVLDMGEPVRILDVAQQLIERSGRPIPIEFTGLREGEKLHEELFGDDEPHGVCAQHPLIAHVPVPGLSDEVIDALPRSGHPAAVIETLCHVAGLPASEKTPATPDYASVRVLAPVG